MITKLKIFEENILVPRNIEGRKEKARQEALKFLSHEIIDGGEFDASEYYNIDIDPSLVKTRIIKGSLLFNHTDAKKLPSWFKNLTVEGFFDCSENDLESLENSPQIIHGSFYCSGNKLTTLKGCSNIINGDFYCSENKLNNLAYGPKEVKGNYDCYFNNVTLKRPKNCKIHGDFNN